MAATVTYLHAGPEKTGTTATQDALFEGRESLASLGVDYWSAAANHSWPLALALGVAGQHEGGFAPYLRSHFTLTYGDPAGLKESLKRELDASEGKFLLSAERASEFNKERLENLRGLLRAGGETIVVFYVREPRGWLTSVVQQRLKEGVPIADSVARYRRLPFRSWIETLGGVFGEDNVRLRVYRQSREVPNATLADLLDAMGESPALADRFPVKWTNSTMPAQAATVLDAVSRIGRAEKFDRQYGWFLEQFLLPNLGGAPFRLGPDILDAVVEENAHQLAWLSERLNVDIAAPAAPAHTSIEHRAPMDEATARLVFSLVAEILRGRSRAMYQKGLIDLVRQDREGAMRAFAHALMSRPDMKRAAVALERLRRGRSDVPGALISPSDPPVLARGRPHSSSVKPAADP
jgi:hypothetical protein